MDADGKSGDRHGKFVDDDEQFWNLTATLLSVAVGELNEW